MRCLAGPTALAPCLGVPHAPARAVGHGHSIEFTFDVDPKEVVHWFPPHGCPPFCISEFCIHGCLEDLSDFTGGVRRAADEIVNVDEHVDLLHGAHVPRVETCVFRAPGETKTFHHPCQFAFE